MPVVANFPFFCIMITMAGGIVCSVLKNKQAFYLNLFILATCFVFSASLLVYMIEVPEQITFMMGHFSAPWGNEIRFGPFETLMATVLTFVMFFVALAQKECIFEFVKDSKINLYYIMMNLMMSSLYALIYTNDLFTAYVFIEINTLCACGFIMAKENGRTIGATIKYLLMSLLGSGLFLVSIILMYDLTGHLLMPNVHDGLAVLLATGEYQLPITIIIGLLAVGLAIKAGLFPFHSWMSHTYNNAMNFSNAISSGLVVKGYIILLIKIFYRVLGIDVIENLAINNVLFVFGVLGVIIGSIDAIRQSNIKRMLAFSSVSQVGYIFMGIGLGVTEGFLAAAFIIIAHSLTKAMLFISAEGLMVTSNHSKYLKDLRGSAHRDPLSGLAFALGGFSMIGLPLLSGFAGKYMLAVSSFSSPGKTWIMLAALAVSTVLNAIYYIRFINLIYAKDANNCQKFKTSINFKTSLLAFIIVNIVVGIFYAPIVEIIYSGLLVL